MDDGKRKRNIDNKKNAWQLSQEALLRISQKPFALKDSRNSIPSEFDFLDDITGGFKNKNLTVFTCSEFGSLPSFILKLQFNYNRKVLSKPNRENWMPFSCTTLWSKMDFVSRNRTGRICCRKDLCTGSRKVPRS